MNEDVISKMTTNLYKTLKLMYDNQVKMTNGSVFTPMTQVELAEQIGVSKITMNAMFRDMQKEGLVYPYGTRRGRYCLSDKAIIIIKQIESIQDKLNV